MNKQKRKLNPIMIPVIVLPVLAVLFFVFNRGEIIFDLGENNPDHVEFGSTYRDPGATAYYRETLVPFMHKDLEVTASGTVDTKKTGSYQITYSASWKKVSASASREVIVEDTTPPEIRLTADPDGYTTIGQKYEEEGFTAVDACDGDISDKVVRKEYDDRIEYTVTDASGNTAKVTRRIIYDDRRAPDITFPQGAAEETVYTDQTWINDYHAEDDVDGDVTANVSIEGSVDDNTVGDYSLTYTVTDAHGNTAEVSRLIHVVPRPSNSLAGEDSKTIYLTFDDGPYAYTEQLLGILAKYDVKATFFTTSAYPAYAYCMALEAQQGHTVAVHTATHNYASIYSSEDAYWADFNSQNAVIAAQTGSYSTIFRFPGGSSNTVSMNYNGGIMSRLASQAAERGYVYFDWNVSSGDAGNTTDSEQVYQNVISGIQAASARGVPSVVLQHDVKDYSVNAVERIILWGLENGYHFSPLQPGSYAPHHSIVN